MVLSRDGTKILATDESAPTFHTRMKYEKKKKRKQTEKTGKMEQWKIEKWKNGKMEKWKNRKIKRENGKIEQ
jgi:hypothetical protein